MTISVVIPCYNGSRFIRKAIESVLAQKRLPDEIIVLDDNSSDNTLAVCGTFGDRIKILSNPKGPSGFVHAWNNAIAAATGDFVSILHQDDVLEPAFISRGMALLEKHPEVRHLFTACYYMDETGKSSSLSYAGQGVVRYSGPAYVRAYQEMGQPHIHRCPGVITHRSIFDQCRYEPAAGHIADDDFFYRVGQYTDVIGILEPLASFRIHADSATGSLEDEWLAGQLMHDYIYQCRQWKDVPFMKEGYPYFVRKARKYIRRYIGHGLQKANWRMVREGMKKWWSL